MVYISDTKTPSVENMQEYEKKKISLPSIPVVPGKTTS